MKNLIITIDGPAGTGKSTVARSLAQRLGYLYLDTGAMYRAVALKAIRQRMDLSNSRLLGAMAARTKVSFRVDPGRRLKVLLDGKDVTEPIRRHAVSEAASVVAAVPKVREVLVRQQRAIGARGRVVAEGRDTGTVVFPRAPIKFFITAAPQERAKRRWQELRQVGRPMSLKEVLLDTKRRDQRDRRRAVSPLRVAQGARRIDNTRLKPAQVLDRMLSYVHQIQNGFIE